MVRSTQSVTVNVGPGGTFTPPPVVGIAGLNSTIAYCFTLGQNHGWQWIDAAHTYGEFSNPAVLSWCYLTSGTLASGTYVNAYEPNENRKLAPAMLDIANYAGGAVNEPVSGVNYATIGRSCMYTSQAFLTQGHPLFCNYILDGKDMSILGWPTPSGNQNNHCTGGTVAGYSFTANGLAPIPTAPGNGNQPYAVLSAAAFNQGNAINPAQPTWSGGYSIGTYGSPAVDESLFKAANGFCRGDLAGCKTVLEAAAVDFTNSGNVGLGGPSYRGEYLGMFTAIMEITKPMIAYSSTALTAHANAEVTMWTIWKNNGNRMPGSYTSISGGGSNFDNETNISITYMYARSWHARIRNAVARNLYTTSTTARNTLATINSFPTPDGSAL